MQSFHKDTGWWWQTIRLPLVAKNSASKKIQKCIIQNASIPPPLIFFYCHPLPLPLYAPPPTFFPSPGRYEDIHYLLLQPPGTNGSYWGDPLKLAGHSNPGTKRQRHSVWCFSLDIVIDNYDNIWALIYLHYSCASMLAFRQINYINLPDITCTHIYITPVYWSTHLHKISLLIQQLVHSFIIQL